MTCDRCGDDCDSTYQAPDGQVCLECATRRAPDPYVTPIVTCARCGRMDCGEFGGCGPDPKVVTAKELR